METGLLHLHSSLRYVVLAALLYAIIKGSKAGEQAVEGKERRPYLIAMIVAHIQLLLGLGLYFVGENGLTALNSLFDTGASLFSSLGFFGIIHFVLDRRVSSYLMPPIQTIPAPSSLYTQCIKSPFSLKKPVLYAIAPLLGVRSGKRIGIMSNTAVNAVDVIPKNQGMKAPDVVYLHLY